MNYISKALDSVRKHPVPAAVAATAGAALLHTAMNGAGAFESYPALRFVPYVANSLATAELNTQRVRNAKGRDLTFSERMKSYLVGAAAPMIAWEGWENIGTTEPVYDILKRSFGEMARQDFPGKGWGSLVDASLAVGTVMAIETAKEGLRYASKLVRG